MINLKELEVEATIISEQKHMKLMSVDSGELLTLIQELRRCAEALETVIGWNESDYGTATALETPKDKSHFECRRQILDQALAELKKKVEL